MKQVIAVTGSNGMIGQAVVRQLLLSNFRVIAITRTSTDEISHPNLEYRQADMRDTAALYNAIAGANTVIHLAARKSDESDSQSINVDGAINLVAACKAHKVHTIINISTQSVRLQKKGIYASTKAAADHILQASGIPTITLLPSVVYSDDRSGIFQSLFAFTRLPAVPIIGSGTTIYHPIHVVDAAKIIVTCLDHPEIQGQSFDVGGLQPWTFNELIDAILKMQSIQRKKIHIPIWLCLCLAYMTRWLPKPPLTRSNVLGATENIRMNPRPITEITGIQPRNLIDGLTEIVTIRHSREKKAEAEGLLRYIGQSFDKKFQPSNAQIDRFLAAITTHQLQKSRSLDITLLRKKSYLSALDNWSRFHDPHCNLQQKILIASAIIECDPVSACWLLPKERSILQILCICIGTSVKTALIIVAGHLYNLLPSFSRNARL